MEPQQTQARHHGVPEMRPLALSDIRSSVKAGFADFRAAPMVSALFAAVFVVVGALMYWITARTGQTYWLVLAAMGFPMVGVLSVTGFYEISRLREAGTSVRLGAVAGSVWAHRSGQLPWLAGTIMFIFLFWFFLGHMIFALFLGLAPMTNVSSSLQVFLTPNGLSMLAMGTAAGAVFSTLVFAISIFGIPLLHDRDVDFMTAMICSVQAVLAQPALFLFWGACIGFVTLLSMVPMFLGLFITLPILGHAAFHLYRAASGTGAA